MSYVTPDAVPVSGLFARTVPTDVRAADDADSEFSLIYKAPSRLVVKTGGSSTSATVMDTSRLT